MSYFLATRAGWCLLCPPRPCIVTPGCIPALDEWDVWSLSCLGVLMSICVSFWTIRFNLRSASGCTFAITSSTVWLAFALCKCFRSSHFARPARRRSGRKAGLQCLCHSFSPSFTQAHPPEHLQRQPSLLSAFSCLPDTSWRSASPPSYVGLRVACCRVTSFSPSCSTALISRWYDVPHGSLVAMSTKAQQTSRSA